MWGKKTHCVCCSLTAAREHPPLSHAVSQIGDAIEEPRTRGVEPEAVYSERTAAVAHGQMMVGNAQSMVHVSMSLAADAVSTGLVVVDAVDWASASVHVVTMNHSSWSLMRLAGSKTQVSQMNHPSRAGTWAVQ